MKSEKFTNDELADLDSAFRDEFLYEDDDVFATIDPLTYRRGDGDQCLHIACMWGNLRLVQLLVTGGADVNARGDMGYTPIQYANTPEIVDLLLKSGADPTIKNEFGNSPVGWGKKV